MGAFTLGNLTTDYVLSVSFDDKCTVAKRPVTRRASGEEIDTGTFVDEPIGVTVVLRLSDSDKSTLETEWDENTFQTITLANTEGEAGTWTFTNAWVTSKNIVFENSVDTDGINRRWRTTLNFIAETATWVAS